MFDSNVAGTKHMIEHWADEFMFEGGEATYSLGSFSSAALFSTNPFLDLFSYSIRFCFSMFFEKFSRV